MWEYRTSKSLLLHYAEPYKNRCWSEPEWKAALDLSYRPLNSTRSHGRLRSTLIPIKSLSKDPRHQGKTTGCILQPAHSLGIIAGQESWLFFLSQSATKARKLLLLPTILSTGIKTPKGVYGLVHCLARNLSGLPGTEKTWKGFAPSVVLGEVRNTPHEHAAVELHNQIKCCAEYPVSSSPFPLSHTHTRKTYFKWPQRSLSNPSFGCPLKRKGCFMVFPSSGARGSRSSQAWRPQVRKMARLVFPEASPLCAVWPRWKEAQQSRAVRAACSAQTWHWPHAQLLLPVPVQVPGLDTVKYPRVRGKPQGFSSHSCYTICRVEKGLSR